VDRVGVKVGANVAVGDGVIVGNGGIVSVRPDESPDGVTIGVGLAQLVNMRSRSTRGEKCFSIYIFK
jgi:hypothetical protein